MLKLSVGSDEGLEKIVPGSRSYSYDPKKWTLSFTIGPPSVAPTCWLE